MTEIDKHYGSQPHSPPAPTGAVASAKAALDSAATAAKATIAGAGDAARDQVEQARRVASDTYGRGANWAGDRFETASRTAVYARRRSAAHLNRTRRTVEDLVGENPIMVGVAGLAVGLLAGALLPGTRRENQAFGRYADEVKDQGYRYALDLAEQGKHFVEENIQGATEAVKSERQGPQG